MIADRFLTKADQPKARENTKCRLSLRESTSFRGAKGDIVGKLPSYDGRKGARSAWLRKKSSPNWLGAKRWRTIAASSSVWPIREDLDRQSRLDHGRPGPGGHLRTRRPSRPTVRGRGRPGGGSAGAGRNERRGCLEGHRGGRPDRGERRCVGGTQRPGAAAADGGTPVAEPGRPPVRSGDADAAVRRRRAGNVSPDLRHAQDHAGLAAAGKIRCQVRRRVQPPDRTVRRGADQGQPLGLDATSARATRSAAPASSCARRCRSRLKPKR